MAHVKNGGYNLQHRTCEECGHPELRHFGSCVDCGCLSFAARKLTAEERKVQQQIADERRNASKWTGDPYSEYTEHLKKVLEQSI